MKYTKNQLLDAYRNIPIERADNMNLSLLVSDYQVTPVNVDRYIPIHGNINSHLKKRMPNSSKKAKPTSHSPASKIEWDNQSGWASRFKKSDDLFNKKPASRPTSRPATPSSPSSPKGLNNRQPPKKADKALSNVIGSLGLDKDDDLVSPTPPPPPPADWMYRDPAGSLQGPFNADTMHGWWVNHYFMGTLLVRRMDSDSFIPLDDLLARVQDKTKPFHSVILPPQPPALNLNALNRHFNQSPVVRNSSPVVDLNGLYHPQPQPQLQRLATDSAASSPVSTPFARPLWASNSPALDFVEQQQQQSRDEFLMALRHRELLEQQQQQQQQQQQFIQQQLLQQQQQQARQQQELHAWQLQQQAQQEAQKQAQEQAQEQLANTHLRDDADMSVQVEAPESTVDSVTEDGLMSPIKTPENQPSVVQPVQSMQSLQPVQQGQRAPGSLPSKQPTTQQAQTTNNNVRGGVNVVTQAELERLQRGAAAASRPDFAQDSPKMSVSLNDVIEKQTNEQAHAASQEGQAPQPAKKAAPAPWAPQAQPESVKERAAPAAPTLKEIQEAEARQSEAKKQAIAAQRAAAQQQQNVARVDDIVPGTLNWGLAGSAAPPTAPAAHTGAPAWGGSNLNQKKSLRQIQEEEEMKERETQKKKVLTAQANAAARGYAASAQRTSQLNGGVSAGPPPGAGGGGAWTVVSGGAKPTPTPAAKPAAAPAPAPKAAPAAPAAPAVSVPPSIAQGSNVREPGAPSDEFTKWCKAALTGLNGTSADELLPILLSFDIEKPDIELIQDMIYASSSTMDGRRFASEFARKRKEDAKGVSSFGVPELTKGGAAKQPQESFKVVQKKKKRV